MNLNKDQVSRLFAEVAGPFSNPSAAEIDIPSTSVPKLKKAETTQDSNGFKGIWMQKYTTVTTVTTVTISMSFFSMQTSWSPPQLIYCWPSQGGRRAMWGIVIPMRRHLKTNIQSSSSIIFYKTTAATVLKFHMEHDLLPGFQNCTIGSGRISKMAAVTKNSKNN